MSKRHWSGLSEEYLQSVFGAAVPLDRAFYEEYVWWWKTLEDGKFIGTGDAEGGMSFAEWKSYEETIFRYEFTARLSGEYPHGKPWAWLDFNSKFGSVTESGEIDQTLFDYRDFVENAGAVIASGDPPQEGWSGRVGFYFRLDTPAKIVLEHIKKMLDRERAKYGVFPAGKSSGRRLHKHPWQTLKLMDEISNKHCRDADFANDRNGDVDRLTKARISRP